jgi:hypothetical protein
VDEPATGRPARWRGLREEARAFFSGLSPHGAAYFVAAGVLLWAYDYYGTGRFFRVALGPWLGLAGETLEAARYFYWFGATFILLMGVPRFSSPRSNASVGSVTSVSASGSGRSGAARPSCASHS